jgi:hypothetical protein
MLALFIKKQQQELSFFSPKKVDFPQQFYFVVDLGLWYLSHAYVGLHNMSLTEFRKSAYGGSIIFYPTFGDM